jgi:hypothetical protein
VLRRRLVACHEGGYSPEYVPFCGLAVVKLSGIRTEVEDAMGMYVMHYAGHDLQPHQEAVIHRVEANLGQTAPR